MLILHPPLTVVVLSQFLFGTRDSHILDSVPEGMRAVFWVFFNLFVVAMLCVDFFCADKGTGGRTDIRSAATWTYVTSYVSFIGRFRGSELGLRADVCRFLGVFQPICGGDVVCGLRPCG